MIVIIMILCTPRPKTDRGFPIKARSATKRCFFKTLPGIAVEMMFLIALHDGPCHYSNIAIKIRRKIVPQ